MHATGSLYIRPHSHGGISPFQFSRRSVEGSPAESEINWFTCRCLSIAFMLIQLWMAVWHLSNCWIKDIHEGLWRSLQQTPGICLFHATSRSVEKNQKYLNAFFLGWPGSGRMQTDTSVCSRPSLPPTDLQGFLNLEYIGGLERKDVKGALVKFTSIMLCSNNN